MAVLYCAIIDFIESKLLVTTLITPSYLWSKAIRSPNINTNIMHYIILNSLIETNNTTLSYLISCILSVSPSNQSCDIQL